MLLLLLLALAFGSAPPSSPGKVAFVRDGKLRVLYLATGEQNVVLEDAPPGSVGFSGNGKLVSAGGRIAGGPSLPAAALFWAPTGETAAYTTRSGGVVLWTPDRRRTILPAGWGATSLAWGPHGELALGRSVCRAPCGVPLHQEVWVWRAGSLRRIAGPLPYSDFVARCGTHVAISAGVDRYTIHSKRLLLDGRDVSRNRTRSWVEPACSADGKTLVAAASANTTPARIGDERRAIWQLLPTRTQLTHPPARRTDENPVLLADGSILFIRTRSVTTRLNLYGRGALELLRDGKLTPLADVGRAENYYGHYNWTWQVAVSK